VFREMEQWNRIRQRVLRDGVSIRQIQRETGLHHETIKKILACSSPPPFACGKREKPKLGAYVERIAAILQAEKDEHIPQKQRHTAKRIFERLREEGYVGGYTQVKEAVRELRRTSQEVFIPLRHEPGEAQMDFGHALVKFQGELIKVAFFVMALPYSDALYVRAYPRECTETLQDGHAQAFAFFKGVPCRISYDNARTCVSQILGAHARALTDGFLQLQSHYLFQEHFCRIYRANEKGVVESMVKFTRLNFFVPVPEVESWKELNWLLEGHCLDDQARRLRGKTGTKADLLREDQAAFLPLPAVPFDACRKASTTANRLSLVRFDANDYSVPVRYAHHPVVVKGYPDKVLICRHDTVMAEHERLWGKEDIAYDPSHYLELLERKPGALDYAEPLAEWELPSCFFLLRGRLEAQGRLQGVKEYIQVLRLLEKHSVDRVAQAIEKALRLRHCSRDIVAQYLYPDEGPVAPTFLLDGHEHLQGICVQSPDVNAYAALLGGLN
jgi:transposase